MAVLILGLVIFLGVHSIRIFADDWRTQQIAKIGANAWKGVYALASIVGFVLIVWGYGMARAQPVVLWTPPVWTRHLAGPLVLLAFVLIAAAYIPRNHFKAVLGHPMVVGVKVWAFAHLLANGTLAAVILFGAFLVWAVVLFAKSRRRDRAAGTSYPPGTASRDVIVVVAGAVAWALFAFALHGWLIGVRPYG